MVGSAIGIKKDLDILRGMHRWVRKVVLGVGLALVKRFRITNSKQMEQRTQTMRMLDESCLAVV